MLGLVKGCGLAQRFSKAMNLVTRRRIHAGYAVGVSSRLQFNDHDAVMDKGARLLFVTPWHKSSIIGTTHLPFEGGPENYRVTESDIRDFVRQINEAYPAIDLKREDVSFFFFWATFAWNLKPLAGIMTDAFPLLGTRRRSYMILERVKISNNRRARDRGANSRISQPLHRSGNVFWVDAVEDSP